MTDESEFETAIRKVRQTESLIARRRALIAKYLEGGIKTARAERPLPAFEATLAENRKYLARLQDDK